MRGWLRDWLFPPIPHTEVVSRLKAQPSETSPRVIYAAAQRFRIGKPTTLDEWYEKYGRTA